MRLLLLCEGDAETAHGSFSGSAHSLISHLRAAGHVVRSADVDLYGAERWLGAGLSFSPERRRWGVRYHLGAWPFLLRSRVADRQIREQRHEIDAVIQIGATFRIGADPRLPYFLYCDSNIRMAERGRATGESQAAALETGEIDSVAEREGEVYRNAAAVFTISERLRRSFIEDFRLDPRRVHAVHAGPNLDLSQFSPTPDDRPPHPPTLLFVGVKFQRKGGDLLLEAFRQVRTEIPEARLRIIGPRSLQLDEPGAECLGFLRKDEPAELARLLDAYRSSDVFCLPTRYEPFGIVFLEAMFFGLPCVGTDAWAVPEMIDDGVTGFLFPPDDAAALADRLLRLLRDPELSRRMGRAGQARARAHFTWSAVIERMSGVMQAALAGQWDARG